MTVPIYAYKKYSSLKNKKAVSRKDTRLIELAACHPVIQNGWLSFLQRMDLFGVFNTDSRYVESIKDYALMVKSGDTLPSYSPGLCLSEASGSKCPIEREGLSIRGKFFFLSYLNHMCLHLEHFVYRIGL